MPLLSSTLQWLRFCSAFGALAVALGALAWHEQQLQFLPAVHLGPWETGKQPLVIVDAGHGGHDGGAVANGVVEKQLSLKLAHQLRRHLERLGLNVRMTREQDRFLELEERCQIAGQMQAAAFVSVHLNTNPDTSIRGLETYFAGTGLLSRPASLAARTAADSPGETLARRVQRHAVAATGAEDRGIKPSQLVVVVRTPCPAVLVECGFLTHAEEVRQLQREAYQEQLTQGIAAGVAEFLQARPTMPPRRR